MTEARKWQWSLVQQEGTRAWHLKLDILSVDLPFLKHLHLLPSTARGLLRFRVDT